MGDSRRGEAGTWRWFGWWDEGGNLDLAETLRHLPANDQHAAQMVKAELWPDELFYVPKASWFVWEGRYLQPDLSMAVDRRVNLVAGWLSLLFEHAHQTVRAQVTLRMGGQDQKAIDKAIDEAWKAWKPAAVFAAGLLSTPGHDKLVKALMGPCGATLAEMDDRYPDHLNTATGIVSLLPDGGVFAHHPGARMTYCVEVDYHDADPLNPAARCPMFSSLVWRAGGCDEAIYWYLIHALGYSLLGDNRYQLIFFLSGPTASGKTTLLEIVSEVLGTLAHRARPELITQPPKGGQRHGRHEASLRGKRLVTLGETNDQLKIDENQLKILTGQPKISEDRLWKETLTDAIIAALLFVANNAMPRVDHLDDALRRRIMVIPMGETIPDWERDSTMVLKIAGQEAEGILSLLVWACRAVVASEGRLLTMPPARVVAKTAEYDRDQNTALLWMAEDCVAANGSSAAVKGSDCVKLYRTWCDANGREALGTQKFYTALAALPGVVRTMAPDQAWFHGFVLRQPPSDYV